MSRRTAPAVSSRARLRPRRNVVWGAGGLVAMILAGLGTFALFSQLAETRPVIKVLHTVHRGEVIGPDDVAVISVPRSDELPALSGDQLQDALGQRAVTDLPAGGLLMAGSFGAPDLAPGLVRVGLKLEQGRIPATLPPPGAKVALVAVPDSATTDATAPPATVEAVLASSPTQAADGEFLVDVNVPAVHGEQVARLGSLRQIALIVRAEP